MSNLALFSFITAAHVRMAPMARPGVATSRGTSLAMLADGETAWSDKENWALADAVPQFTVGQGNERATFWSALVASTPELAARSGADCEVQFREVKTDDVQAGAAPTVLEDWSRLDDGRYTGRVAGGRV